MVTTPAPAQKATAKWVVDATHTTVGFSVRHNMISNLMGGFSKFEVDLDFDEAKPENSRLDAKIDSASFSTGRERIDTEVKSPSFLDVAKFPHLTFKTKRIVLLNFRRYAMVGDLTIRDVTKEVSFDVTLSDLIMDPRGNQRVGFHGETTINRFEFGTTWANKLPSGLHVAGELVKINLDGELMRPVEAPAGGTPPPAGAAPAR